MNARPDHQITEATSNEVTVLTTEVDNCDSVFHSDNMQQVLPNRHRAAMRCSARLDLAPRLTKHRLVLFRVRDDQQAPVLRLAHDQVTMLIIRMIGVIRRTVKL